MGSAASQSRHGANGAEDCLEVLCPRFRIDALSVRSAWPSAPAKGLTTWCERPLTAFTAS